MPNEPIMPVELEEAAAPARPALDSIINIDGIEYDVIAETAKKVANVLTIKTMKDGNETITDFDGSTPASIDVGDANKIKVNMDRKQVAYAAITISANDPDPAEGTIGDIWFKY